MRTSQFSAFLLVFLTLVLAGATEVTAADDGSSPSTLADFARATLATHEAIGLADSQLRRADADRRLTSSALMPRLDLNGAYTRYNEAQAIEFAPGEVFEIRPLSDWSWSADLRQTLFYGLRDWRARDVAKLRQDIAKLERTTTAADLVLEVAYAFFAAVASEQRLEVESTALEQIEAQLKVAQRRFEVGEVTIADVARWRSEVAAAQQRSVVAEGDAFLSLHRLGRLSGVSGIERLAPPGPIPAPPGESSALQRDAFEDRPEMAVLHNQLESAGLMIKIEKGAWLPEVEAHAQYFQQKAEFPSQDWASLALTLRVPIYDGGLTAARVAQAREDLRQVELLGQTLRRTISDQVDSAAISLRAAEAALEAAEERSTAAGEAYRQVERAYRAGEASATDLLATTTEVIDAETVAIIARWQRELQAISLRHAVGQAPLPDLDLQETLKKEDQS